jgi:ribosome-associated protein
MMDSRKFAEACAQRCLEKKGESVTVLDLTDRSSVADFFVICSGSSDRQVSSIADFVAEEGRRMGTKVLAAEGVRDGRWALVDFGAVIVHVFQDQLRDFYSLESLWGDAPRVRVKEDGTVKAVEVDDMVRPSDFEPSGARH